LLLVKPRKNEPFFTSWSLRRLTVWLFTAADERSALACFYVVLEYLHVVAAVWSWQGW
jgi:hypothetical protein